VPRASEFSGFTFPVNEFQIRGVQLQPKKPNPWRST
jgi:hypothetical protein